MARHDDRDGVGAIGGAYGTARAGAADRDGDLAVASGFTGGDFAQGRPHVALERRAAGFDWEIGEGVDVAVEIGVELRP